MVNGGEPLHGRPLAAMLDIVPTDSSYRSIPFLAGFSFCCSPWRFWLWEADLLLASLCGQGSEDVVPTSLPCGHDVTICWGFQHLPRPRQVEWGLRVVGS